MYRREERPGVFRIDLRGDAMAKIEYMTGTLSVRRQDACDLRADRCRA